MLAENDTPFAKRVLDLQDDLIRLQQMIGRYSVQRCAFTDLRSVGDHKVRQATCESDTYLGFIVHRNQIFVVSETVGDPESDLFAMAHQLHVRLRRVRLVDG